MANKNEIFNKLVESKVLSEDVNISDYTKSELLSMYKKKEKEQKAIEEVIIPEETIIEKEIVVPEEIVVEKEIVVPEEIVVEKEVIVPEEIVVEKEVIVPEETVVEKEVIVPEETVVEKEVTKFRLGDNFKPVYRINAYKSGTFPVIKVSASVYEYIKSQIHIDDICDTPVEKQLKSIVYHIRTQPTKSITVTAMPNETVRCTLANGVLMSQIINE